MTSRGTNYCCCVIIKNDTKTVYPKTNTKHTQQIIVCTIIILFSLLVLNCGKLYFSIKHFHKTVSEA